MESHIENRIKLVLELDETEVAWLQGLMQNPLCPQDQEEKASDREMRNKFWEALTI